MNGHPRTNPTPPLMGCLTCRRRKVRCDLTHPICSACNRLRKECIWQDMSTPAPPRPPRRPNDSACEQCRSRKLKCEGDREKGACVRCQAISTECDWTSERAVRQRTGPAPPRPQQARSDHSSTLGNAESGPSTVATAGPPSVEVEVVVPDHPMSQTEIERLIDVYFETVHHFGFLTFIHEMRFKRLLSRGKAPRDLTMAMVANVLRFACPPTPENRDRGDALIDAIIPNLLPRCLNGFGVTQLMTMLLVSHYEGQRGRTGSRWLLSSLCVRMMQLMSLHTLDHTFPDNLSSTSSPSPLITYEALRRLAWAVFFQDSTLDGGRYGSSLIDLETFRIQLPCSEESFLGNDNARTESIFSPPSEHTACLSAFLIRATYLRRRGMNAVHRISHHDMQVDEIQSNLAAIEAAVNEFVSDSLPARYRFTTDNVFLHRQRLPAFLLLHILLHKLYFLVTMVKLAMYRMDPASADLVANVRHQRISHAIAVSGILAQGLKYFKPEEMAFDVQSYGEAYYALEILLFEPRRLVDLDLAIAPDTKTIEAAIPPLLQILRLGAQRSEVTRVLHVEAVHRLLRFDYLSLLNPFDLEAFSSEYQPGHDEAEFDFRDFRFAKIERLRSVKRAEWLFRDEPLLEYSPEAPSGLASAMVSPRLDASHISTSNPVTSTSTTTLDVSPLDPPALGSNTNTGQAAFAVADPWLRLLDPMENAALLGASDDLAWLLGETGSAALQTGDPAEFWRQISGTSYHGRES